MKETRPILGVTMGDPSGAGPEILVKALCLPDVRALCRPIAIGDAATIRQAAQIVGSAIPVQPLARVSEATLADGVIEVLDLHNVDLSRLVYGRVDAMAGQAAYECVIQAVDLALAGEIAAVASTLP